MTTATADVDEFVAAVHKRLPGSNFASNAMACALYGKARVRGWALADLADWCTDKVPGDRRNGGIVMDRLRRAAEDPTAEPRAARAAATFTQPKPWCGTCQEAGRWLLDPKTQVPTGRCSCWTAPS